MTTIENPTNKIIFHSQKVNTREVRAKLGMSIEEFATAYCIPIRIIQSWELGNHNPEGAIGAYLKVIEKNPNLVADTLKERNFEVEFT